MRLIAHGIDIVDVTKFGRFVEKPAYVERCFTPGERAQCEGRAERFAARFAAKEAVLKALGIGIADGISLKDVEVVFDGGIPGVKLLNLAESAAAELGVDSWLLSFAYTSGQAVASVIATGS
jgi:holo-[acyl-carrier protein] synthase